MLLRSTDVDPVAAIRQHILHPLVGLHQLALLVDDDSGERFRLRHLAAIGLDFARQQLEQRRLPRAVRPDDSDPVTALDAQGEIANDLPLAIGLGHVLGFDHGFRSYIVLGQRELRSAGGAEHRGALRPHLVQLGKAPLIAAAPSRDTALQPMRLDLELGVELLGSARFLIIDALRPGLETAETDLGPAQLATVEPNAAASQSSEEGPVVADDDESPGVALQPILQPFDRAEVEMVGRLVQQQDVGVLRQSPRDCRTPPFAAAGRRGVARQVDAELVGDRRGLMRLGRVASVQHPIVERPKPIHVWILLEQHDIRARHDRAFALIRIDQSREALEQGRLARPIAADQRETVAFADVQVEAAKQPPLALDQSEIFVRENWRRHGDRH